MHTTDRLVRFLIVSALALPAQQPAEQAKPEVTTTQAPVAEVSAKDTTATFTSKVNLVPATAVVRDAKGNAIGTLTKDDFRVFDNGKPQVISKFSVEKPASPVIIEKNEDIDMPDASTKATGPDKVIANRFVAYVFDDLHLHFEDIVRARQAVSSFVEKSLQPNERVAIYTTSGKNTLEFTSDVQAFQAALGKLQPNPTRGGTIKCPDISYYMADKIVNQNDGGALALATQDYRQCTGNQYITPQETMSAAQTALADGELESRQTTNVLKQIIRRLSAAPGQRSIVLTSPGFIIAFFNQQDITDVTDRAVRANVVINSLDARGVWTPPQYSAQTPAGVGGPPMAVTASGYYTGEANAQGEVLGSLADGTGGRWVHDNNDLGGGYKLLADAPEFIYVLGFVPSNLKMDGSYHKLKIILVTPKGDTLQARRGYYAAKKGSDAADQTKEDIRGAVFSRDVIKDIPVDVHTQFFKPSDTDAKLTVNARVSLKELPFKKADGRNQDDLTIVFALFDDDGNFISAVQKLVTLNLKDDTLKGFEERSGSGVNIKAEFDTKIGGYVLRVVVRDAQGQKLAAENSGVRIP
jgi:VWFA-related protein